MRLSVDNPLWGRLFEKIRDDITTDINFLTKCHFGDPMTIYEEEIQARGITMIRSPVDPEELKLFGPLWEYAEFPDENYVEIMLRWS